MELIIFVSSQKMGLARVFGVLAHAKNTLTTNYCFPINNQSSSA
jgi:hypothetical protein